jgi:hypothetical protein
MPVVDTADGHREGGRPHTMYVYATTLLRGRSRFALGLPRLRPPGHGTGWEVCAISCVEEGILVSWRGESQIVSRQRRDE